MIAKAFLPLALCLVPTALALAQTVTPTASISGVVMTDEPVSRPLRMVSVMIESGDIRLPESTVTDDAGGFTLANLPAGNYSLSASKPGYVPSYYGGKRPGRGPGVPIAVLAGQHVTAITLQMLHGSVITGIVTHRTGQPAARSRVEAKPVQITNGTTQQVGGSGYGTTDDRGRYRIFGLAPGDYVVQAMSESFDVSEVRRVMAAEIQWGERVTSPGGAPVDGIGPAALPPAPASGRTVKYADVFYPGTVDAAAAVAVSLGRNEERDGVDFSTSLVPTAVVRGVVLDADGQPSIGAQVRATPRQTDASSPLGSFLSLLGTSAQSFAPDGRFALGGMEPVQ